jgi:hypothetical protein
MNDNLVKGLLHETLVLLIKDSIDHCWCEHTIWNSVMTVLEIFEGNHGILEENHSDQARIITIKLQPT